MNKSTLDVVILQMTSIDDMEANLRFIEQTIQTIDPQQNIDLICLPENCLFMRLKEGEKIGSLHLDNPALSRLAAIAKARQCFFHLGSIPLELNGKLYNSSVLISSVGEVISSYQKIHLFDIQLEGRPPNRESDVFTHGTTPHSFNLKGWIVGESICYDIRFSELYSHYAKLGVDLILIPAAFLGETGKAHWEVLLRARAIESQAYVVAAAQAGVHKNSTGSSRETFGHSTIVGPWGDIKASLSNSSGILMFQLKKDEITKVRTQIPMQAHRRL
jgi:predicted amidohydrolase